MSRQTPSKYLKEALASVTELENRIYWIRQEPDAYGKHALPAAVYQSTDSANLRAFQGQRTLAQEFTFDVRAMGDDLATVLGNKALTALRSMTPGRLSGESGPVDAYDDDLKVARKIWTVEIRT